MARQKIQVVETNSVNRIALRLGSKNAGEKMKVSSIMLLKTNASKMSETSLSIMLLKNKLVIGIFPLC